MKNKGLKRELKGMQKDLDKALGKLVEAEEALSMLWEDFGSIREVLKEGDKK